MTHYDEHFGWSPNPAATAAYVGSLPEPTIAQTLLAGAPQERKDAFLWLPLMSVKPDWKRGAQGIGDCVSWGAELAATMLMAIQAVVHGDAWEAEAATEPIYGGGRVEANGGRLAGYGDGSYGAAAAKWVRNWGVLLRQDYSAVTGNPDHDLRFYSKDRAKSWGNFGCGGQRDERGNGPLDLLARKHPVKATSLVENAEQLDAALQSGYPVTVASNVGFGRMARDSNGIVRASGNWSHQMMFGGVKWLGINRLFRLFNSWGKSASGPDPDIVHQAVSDCSWWVTDEDANRMLRQGDSFAFSDIVGFPPRVLDFQKSSANWG